MDARTNEDIAVSIAQERRPAIQIGSDVDYVRVTRGVRMLLFGIVALVILLLGLSFVVKIDEVTLARGDFTPVQRVQVIQTPQGGAIQSMLVQNGEVVQKGQVLARFRAEDLARDLERTTVRLAYLQVQIERLDAFASNRTPDFTQFQKQYPDMVAEAEALHTGQVHQLESSLEQQERQIDVERSAITAAQKEIPAAKASSDAAKELLQRIHEGVDLGVLVRNRLAQVEEQSAQAERVYTQLVTSIDQHNATIKRYEAERNAISAKSVADARNQRAELMEQLNELRATQAAYQSRSADIEVRAPVNGVVQKISETPIGTVIPPGGTVCEVVPTDGGVLIQAHVSPRDIGFVHVGQKAMVKSDAFDYSRFGSIPGKVVRIAALNTPGTVGQAPYIMVEIALDQPYVGIDKSHVVTPGMTGEAAILTGEKTIFQYLLKPIYYTLDSALRER